MHGVFATGHASTIDQEDLAFHVWKLTAGHPLHVGYVARQLAAAASDNQDLFQLVAKMPACHNDVEQYYRLIFENPETAVAREALSVMAACSFELSAVEVASVIAPSLDWHGIDDALRRFRYLFRVIGDKYYFAHDSLRVFAESQLGKGHFSIDKQIAFLCQLKNDPRTGEHLLHLSSDVPEGLTAVDEINCDWLSQQISNGASIRLLDEGLTLMALAELKRENWGKMARWWSLQSCLQRARDDEGIVESTLVGSWLAMQCHTLVERYSFVSMQFLSTVYPGPDLVDLLEQYEQFDLAERLLNQQMSLPLPPIDALSTAGDYEFVRYIRHAARKLPVHELLPVLHSRTKAIGDYHQKYNLPLFQNDAARIAEYVETIVRQCLCDGDLNRAEEWLLEESVEMPDSDRAELYLRLCLLRDDLTTNREHISSAIGYVESLSVLEQMAVSGRFDDEVRAAIRLLPLNPLLQNRIEWYNNYAVSSRLLDLFHEVSICTRLRLQDRLDAIYQECGSIKCRVGRILAQETARIAEKTIGNQEDWKATLHALIEAIGRLRIGSFNSDDTGAAQGFVGAIGLILQLIARYAKANSFEADFVNVIEHSLLPALVKSRINYASGRLSLFEMLQNEALSDDFGHRLLTSVEDSIVNSISHNASNFIDLSGQCARAGDMIAAKRLLVRGIRAAFSYGYRKDTTINDFLVAFDLVAPYQTKLNSLTNLYPRAIENKEPTSPPQIIRKDDEIELVDLGIVLRKVRINQANDGRSSIFFSETEITNQMYALYLNDTGQYRDDSALEQAASRRFSMSSTASPAIHVEDDSTLWRNGKFPEKRADHPVSYVTTEEAAEFCKWLNARYSMIGIVRLPTDEEWLSAAYGKDRKYPWGDDSKVWTSESTVPVKSRPDLRTPEGLFEMWGNVSELVLSDSNGYGGKISDKDSPLITQWLGTSNTDEVIRSHTAEPRQNYWGYTHSSRSRSDKWGFRILYVLQE